MSAAVAKKTSAGSLRHVLRSQQFTRESIEQLILDTQEIRSEFHTEDGRVRLRNRLRDKLAISLFYEPSTRTRTSFEAAAMYLGMNVISTENAKEFSSAAKGETLEDTYRVISRYFPDVVVMRHYQDNAAMRAASMSTSAVINAGDGKGQHPTQALLDVFTIFDKLGRLDGITIVIGGDLKHGRTARSLTYLLSKFNNVSFIFVSPKSFRIGEDIKEHLEQDEVRRRGVRYSESELIDQHLPQADVVYWTRVQKERMPWWMRLMSRRIAPCYRITAARCAAMKQGAIIMHPLPRIDEIEAVVDQNPRAAYFDQAENGMWVRMALLCWVVNGHTT